MVARKSQGGLGPFKAILPVFKFLLKVLPPKGSSHIIAIVKQDTKEKSLEE